MEYVPVCPMSDIKRILLLTDCAGCSEGAIGEAIKLSSRCEAELYAMAEVSSSPDYEMISPHDFQQMERQTAARLDSIKKTAQRCGVACEVILFHGESTYNDVVQQVKRLNIDLIVLERHEYKGFIKWLMRGVVVNIVGVAPCRVLVVPKEARIEGKKVLIATDGSRHSMAAAAEGVGIAKRLGSGIIVLSCVANSGGDELSKAISNIDIVCKMAEGISSVETLTPEGRPYEAIVEAASTKGADLIVMGSYGKTGIKELLMGSTTEKVIGHAACAVLVVRDRRQEKVGQG
ncbi:universal stress protein [Candidatus Magnetominusculus dajiuhuensis]|uniref:universal stress protein n=1 Tax=Candidatus Magnetominusculus dajiuhuensis TaxID=3137712 RepID=UPI003B43D410